MISILDKLNHFGIVIKPARRIGQRLGSDPSTAAGDVGMRAVLSVRSLSFCLTCLCPQCVKSRGLGGWPPLKSGTIPFLFVIVHLGWCEVSQRLMQSLVIVKHKVFF